MDEQKSIPVKSKWGERLILLGTWLIAFSAVLLAVFVGWQTRASAAAAEVVSSTSTPRPTQASQAEAVPDASNVALPALAVSASFDAIPRDTRVHTIIPSRPRSDVVSYTIGMGDSLFAIAKKFNVEPETLWWANDDTLENADAISPGMPLRIPPVDGVYYRWQEGDSLEAIADRFEAEAEDIVSFIGNKIDLTDPQIEPGQWVMIPGGKGEFKTWVVPTIPRGKAGVNTSSLGPGACSGSYDGALGTGTFIWPSSQHVLSGNDYWDAHLAIDISIGVGDPVFASDAGVVVFAGWSYGGYGYMVMVDHGNGYQTLYAHLSAVSAYCGQSVSQGTAIGSGGSTGNSTGPHLHFEVRYNGGWVNPWYVLP
ncbi:MAG: peptidoglycan DD-metalloendopeptidase family protein [Chloroflexota bacterium]